MTKFFFTGILITFLLFVGLDILLRLYLSIKYQEPQYLKFKVSINYSEPGQQYLEGKLINFPAYRMQHIYFLLKNEVIKYRPDIILIYEAWNDAFISEIV